MMRRVVGLAAVALVGLVVPSAVRGETIGAAVMPRSLTDTATGSIFALNGGFTQPGTISSWSFYNNNPGQIGQVIA